MKHLTRITPNNVLELKDNEIFVFGSNTKGVHGAGAALTARQRFGAKMGIGEGLTGQSYALPTVVVPGVRLGMTNLARRVATFIECAKENPHFIFLVTEVGCGLAGFSAQQVAPMFRKAMNIENIHLPHTFWRILNKKHK